MDLTQTIRDAQEGNLVGFERGIETALLQKLSVAIDAERSKINPTKQEEEDV